MITRLNAANEAQAEIISALKADTALTARVPASRIYPQQAPDQPQRPFILFGSPIVTPSYVDGGDHSTMTAAIHCFANSGGGILDGRLFATDVASHVARVINAIEGVDLGDGVQLAIFVQQIQVMQDGDASAWHSFVTFRAEAT